MYVEKKPYASENKNRSTKEHEFENNMILLYHGIQNSRMWYKTSVSYAFYIPCTN